MSDKDIPGKGYDVQNSSVQQPKELASVPEVVGSDPVVKQELASLEAAVGGIPVISNQVDKFWKNMLHQTGKEKEVKNSGWSAWLKTTVEAVRSGDRLTAIGGLSSGLDLFQQHFFNSGGEHHPDKLIQKTLTKSFGDGVSIDFATLDDTVLQKMHNDLQYEMLQQTIPYKKLHYLYLMSQSSNELLKRKGTSFEEKSAYQKIVSQAQPGDVIAFANNGDFFNGMLTAKSGNPLAHIGVLDGSPPDSLCHSTMDGDFFHPAGGKRENLEQYLEKTKPRVFVLIRAKQQGKLVSNRAREMVQKGFAYDRSAAVADLGAGGEGLEEGYNCGEFVGEVLGSALGITIDKKKDALPGTYLTMPEIEPVYMDNYT